MKILHVISTLDPVTGGPPMVAARLAAGQVSLGHEVSLLSYDPGEVHARIDQSVESIPHFDLVQRIALSVSMGVKQLLNNQIPPELASALSNCDVAHLHGVWDPLVLAASKQAYRVGCPYVVMPHGMLDPWSLSQSKLKKRLALFLGYRRVLNRCAFLHLLNGDELQLLEPLKLDCTCFVIPNGVYFEEFSPLPEAGGFRCRHTELGSDPYVLFMSRLHFKKGLDFLADAFALAINSIPNLRLVVAGPDDGAQADFLAQIHRLALSSRVHLVGPIYGREKYEALVDASCFCLSSRQEGFSMAIVESLAAGTPVVISENCHFPEVAEVNAGLVVNLRPNEIAQALIEVCSNTEQSELMGQAGIRLVRDRFTWGKIAEQSLEAYSKFVRPTHH